AIRPDKLPRLLAEDVPCGVAIAVERDAASGREEGRGDLAESRPDAVMEVERARDAERARLLEPEQGRRRPRPHAGATLRNELQRRRGRVGAPKRRERDAEHRGREHERIHLSSDAELPGNRGRDEEKRERREGKNFPCQPEIGLHACPSAGRGVSSASSAARASAARSSSRTCSSAAIASSFIRTSTSCWENLARSNRSVRRRIDSL